jgi:acetylornithine/N-succinyldiaminopimelate aminotransferase
VLIEPIMGEGGMREVSWPFLRALRALCDEKGILLVLDEVQSGMGRTGRLFAHEWAGITPDVMATAKGLGGGFPVGACLTTTETGAGMTAGSHGSTFGGNPLAMAVGNAVLDVMLAPGFLDHVAEMGLRLKQRLAALKDEHDAVIDEVRGQGLMLGVKCKVPNQLLVQRLAAERMLTVQAGDNVVRLLPPLIVGEAEIDEACAKIDAACAALAAGAPAPA